MTYWEKTFSIFLEKQGNKIENIFKSSYKLTKDRQADQKKRQGYK